MRVAILGIVSGVGMLISAAPMAAESETTVVAQRVSNSQAIVCHNMTHDGMLLQKSVCRTQYAWDKERRLQEDWLKDLQLRSTQTGTK